MITLNDLDKFILECKAISDEYCDKQGFKRYEFGYDDLKKNIRVWHSDLGGHSKSLHCFIDKETGDVYKGSWKAVVKNGKRGNILDPDIRKFMSPYGTAYLR